MTFRKTVDNFLQALAGGDPDAIAALFVEAVAWKIAGSPAVPWIRLHDPRGRRRVLPHDAGRFRPGGARRTSATSSSRGPHAVILNADFQAPAPGGDDSRVPQFPLKSKVLRFRGYAAVGVLVGGPVGF
ncbi:hypothetical protein [Saccharopolyspora hattusasensis]|uniref:hypothetical protein n=1 Tax=Saccharopolyspora hattusasensis TaxID=1128679 RepID=UPI003D955AD5